MVIGTLFKIQKSAAAALELSNGSIGWFRFILVGKLATTYVLYVLKWQKFVAAALELSNGSNGWFRFILDGKLATM